MKKLIVIMLVILSACEKEVEVEKIVFKDKIVLQENVSLTADLRVQISTLTSQVSSLSNELKQARSSSSLLTAEIAKLAKELSLAQVDLDKANNELDDSNSELEDSQSGLSDATDTIIRLTDSIADLMEALEQYETEGNFVYVADGLFTKTLNDITFRRYDIVSINNRDFLVTAYQLTRNSPDNCYNYMELVSVVDEGKVSLNMRYDCKNPAVLGEIQVIGQPDGGRGGYQNGRFYPVLHELDSTVEKLVLDAIEDTVLKLANGTWN